MIVNTKTKGKRGFASMSNEKRLAIAILGGKAAHAQKKAHQWTKEEAIKAGRKGGLHRKNMLKQK